MSRVVVIGPGSIGGAVAGALTANGHDVVIAARTPFAELRVEYPDGEIVGPARCPAEPDDSLDPAAVVVAVKAHQTSDAAAWIRAASAGGAPVYVLQNGVEQEATVRPYVGAATPVLPTVVNLPAHRPGPGHVVVTGRANLTVPGTEGDVLAALLEGSFVRVHVVDDWQSPAWIKLMMNAAMGGVGVLTQRDNRVFADDEARVLGEALMEEVAAVGRAEGATIPAELPSQMIDRVRAAAGGHASSIVVDRRNGDPTEWQVRNAAVGRIGRRHGIATPLNDLITTLIRLGEPES
ncbi:MAG: 2-dehydropantoate 2-reductase [Actinomycetota bacterium]